MISIVTIDHIVLHAGANYSAMLNFYTQILGCKIERELPEFHLTQLRAGNAIIDLLDKSDHDVDQAHQNVEHFCLTIEQKVDQSLIDYLSEHGINSTQISHNYGAQGFADSIYIQDPLGNNVELKQHKNI